jgi:hypothetical protein
MQVHIRAESLFCSNRSQTLPSATRPWNAAARDLFQEVGLPQFPDSASRRGTFTELVRNAADARVTGANRKELPSGRA